MNENNFRSKIIMHLYFLQDDIEMPKFILVMYVLKRSKHRNIIFNFTNIHIPEKNVILLNTANKSIFFSSKFLMYVFVGFFTAFKCTYCDARYTQSADLNKHLRKHIGPNTYKCDRCDKSYRLLRELRKHASEHYVESLTDKGQNIILNETH